MKIKKMNVSVIFGLSSLVAIGCLVSSSMARAQDEVLNSEQTLARIDVEEFLERHELRTLDRNTPLSLVPGRTVIRFVTPIFIPARAQMVCLRNGQQVENDCWWGGNGNLPNQVTANFVVRRSDSEGRELQELVFLNNASRPVDDTTIPPRAVRKYEARRTQLVFNELYEPTLYGIVTYKNGPVPSEGHFHESHLTLPKSEVTVGDLIRAGGRVKNKNGKLVDRIQIYEDLGVRLKQGF